jgi:tRNA(fMet)-specific endonuclease VapC
LPLLLDTSVAVELLDGAKRTMDRVAGIDGQFLSVISWVELEAGAYREEASIAQRRVRLDGFLERVEVLEFTVREIAAYSAIIAGRGFSRKLVTDRMIAATALANDLALATLNARDFRDIAGLKIEDWST